MPAKRNPSSIQIPERKRLEQEYRALAPRYKAAAGKVLRKLQGLVAAEGINATYKYRVKSFDSYFEKILRQRKQGKARAKLTDIVGFRIVCPFLSDLEQVEAIIRRQYRVLELETKGAEHSFREFGYDSIHMLIDLGGVLKGDLLPSTKRVAEIQLRTILQDAWAEVEHELIYKSGESALDEPIKRKLASLNATLTLSDYIFQEIREYQQEVQQRTNRRKATIETRLLTMEEAGLTTHLTARDGKPVPAPRQHKSEADQMIFEALEAHSNDEFVKAIAIYSNILRMKTNRNVRSVIYNHRGMAYIALSQYHRATKDFTAAIRYNAENFRAYNNRALTYRIRGDYEHALRDLDRSIEINAIQTEAYYIRGLTHYDLQNYAKALHDCEEVLNIKPGFDAAQHLKSLVNAKAGK